MSEEAEEAKFELIPVDETPQEVSYTDPFASVEDIRKRVLLRKGSIDQQYLEMGRDLFDIYYNKKYLDWDYETFTDYVFNEVGYADSTADKFRYLWKKYVMELGIAPDRLHGVGYAKADMLKPIITNKNADDWLDKARALTIKDLRVAINAEKSKHLKYKLTEGAAPPSPAFKPDPLAQLPALPTDTVDPYKAPIMVEGEHGPVPLVTEDQPTKKQFLLFPDQWRYLHTILQEMARTTGSDKEGHNLICALQEMMASRIERGDKREEKPGLYMKGFELRFGGKLLWLKSEEQATLVKTFIDGQPDLFKGAMTNE